MKKRLGALMAAIVVSAVLAAAGGAAKPIDSVTCSLSAGTTFTWVSGTTRIDYTWERADTTVTGQGFFFPPNNGSGSTNITTPSDAATVQATFTNRRGVGGRTPFIGCTA